MSWTLGDATLKQPSEFQRRRFRNVVSHQLINGNEVRDKMSEKYIYRLKLEDITLTQWTALLTEVDKNTPVSFTVADGSLSIGPVDVFIDLSEQDFLKGSTFRSTIDLTLTETDGEV